MSKKSSSTTKRGRSASRAESPAREAPAGRKVSRRKSASDRTPYAAKKSRRADLARKATSAKRPARARKRGPTPPGTADSGLTQKVVKPRAFEVRKSAIAGRGAFAKRALKKGVRIAEYTGVRLTPDEADEKYPFPEDGTPHHTFLFNLDEHTVVDGSEGGDPSRFINHSCDPNCEAVIEDDRIFVETVRAIEKGEELVYDYQFILEEPHTAARKKEYPCHCGSPNCKGTILADKRKHRK